MSIDLKNFPILTQVKEEINYQYRQIWMQEFFTTS